MNTLPRRGRSRVPVEDPDAVALGRHVEVELVDRDGACERLVLDVVPEKKADFAAGFLGAETPLAKAIAGRRAGVSVPYHVGDLREVRIISVAPAQRAPEEEAADHDAILQKAISQSEQAEAARFSLTVDLKWGGTDPSSIEDNWE
jgi:hypothetical protein